MAARWGTSQRQRLRLGPLYAALRLADRWPATRVARPARAFAPGVSVVIPDRDAPEMLAEALASLREAATDAGEPVQVIVVANGAPRERYDGILGRFPELELVHSEAPLGFSAAIVAGLARASHDWTLLLNNDMTLAPGALRELMLLRAADVFAAGAQIFQRSASGRREETGFTDWYRNRDGLHLFHADPRDQTEPREQLCASGGAALFQTEVLSRYARDSRCYDPFYWEDVEWGVRAWRDGYRVLFCPRARAWHRHRATVSRFYDEAAIAGVLTRNRVLFEARHAILQWPPEAAMERVCQLPYEAQRELARPRLASTVRALRRQSRRSPQPLAPPDVELEGKRSLGFTRGSYSYRLHAASPRALPRVLLATPFAVYPPRHGGARRIAELTDILRRDCDIILVSDEATQYDARSYAHFDGLHSVHLVQRWDTARTRSETTLGARMRSHCHEAVRHLLRETLERESPRIVQVEHAELAPLVELRRPGQRWVLTLHDACGAEDFHDAAESKRFREHVLAAYDAIVVCSKEDARMVEHRRVVCVPNGARHRGGAYAASQGAQVLFMGPFRYAQNLEGIRAFLREAWPAVRARCPLATLLILGGDEAAKMIAGDALFAQPGVRVLGHREDVPELLAASALSINPLAGIRGSAVKLIESLMAGRACVTTDEGARGFRGTGLAGVVQAATISDMAEPVAALLADPAARHRLEAPRETQLAPFRWEASAALQKALYAELLKEDA
jgi:GT2 family glycosyltransferase/glycosyltransferase involved in cell wall biosynthesis